MRLYFILFGIAAFVWAADKSAEQAKYLAEGPEKMLVARRCANCHTAGNFTKFRKTEEEWAQVMADMINRNAEIPDDDYDPIVGYLARNYGPDAKLSINRAPAEEIGKLLALSKEVAKSLIAFRDARGPFKDFDDLSKAPGLDANTLEAKRDLLIF
jgi:competence protein ComEA